LAKGGPFGERSQGLGFFRPGLGLLMPIQATVLDYLPANVYLYTVLRTQGPIINPSYQEYETITQRNYGPYAAGTLSSNRTDIISKQRHDLGRTVEI